MQKFIIFVRGLWKNGVIDLNVKLFIMGAKTYARYKFSTVNLRNE